ncbi:MAG: pilus assembly protein PilM [candidate division NC10 bacterium]|nr:pilus assembly protein PilM [candidate division NC10 bacterium]MDE2320894.1 pilus assembly protein PilM [candidate division NC10 bacterium]
MRLDELIPKPKVGLGIDLRGGQLCHALLSKAFGRIQLLDWGIEELPVEEQDRPKVLTEKLVQLWTRLPKRPTFVTVGLPRRLVTMRSVSMPAVGEEELKGILEYEVERYIPFPPEEVQYDFQVLERDAEKAIVLLAAARKEEISRYLAFLEEAGIKPTAFGVSAFASLNTLLFNQERDAEPLRTLIDLRDGEAELGLAKNGILRYSRYLTLGPTAPLDLLMPEISTLLAHLETNGGQHAGRIAIAGPGAGRGEGDLLHHLAERTGLEVEFLQPFQRIKASGVDPQVAHFLGAAVGLALHGLVTLPVDIDLLPKELAPPRRDPSLAVTIRLVALVVALGLAYLVNGAIREHRALAELTATLNRVQAEAAKVDQLKGEVASLRSKIATLDKIDREEVRKLDVLKELVQVLPKGVTLTLFSVDGREARVGGSITGSASDLISILEQSPVFENVQFTSPVASRAESQDFQIKMHLEAKKEKRP